MRHASSSRLRPQILHAKVVGGQCCYCQNLSEEHAPHQVSAQSSLVGDVNNMRVRKARYLVQVFDRNGARAAVHKHLTTPREKGPKQQPELLSQFRCSRFTIK